MTRVADMLKPTEAAVVSCVAVRDVNRVIDEAIIPEAFYRTDNGRFIEAAACALIAFYVDSAAYLTAEKRMWTIREAGARIDRFRTLEVLLTRDWIFHDEFLDIDLKPFFTRTKERLDRLHAARAMVVSDPKILSGTPVIRGTRIPVHDVAASVAAGIPKKRILEAYPALTPEKIDLAVIYAEANPARGRPRSGDLPAGAVVVSDRRVPRRGKAG